MGRAGAEIGLGALPVCRRGVGPEALSRPLAQPELGAIPAYSPSTIARATRMPSVAALMMPPA